METIVTVVVESPFEITLLGAATLPTGAPGPSGLPVGDGRVIVAYMVLVSVNVLVNRIVVVISEAVGPEPTVMVATDSTTETLTIGAALDVCPLSWFVLGFRIIVGLDTGSTTELCVSVGLEVFGACLKSSVVLVISRSVVVSDELTPSTFV